MVLKFSQNQKNIDLLLKSAAASQDSAGRQTHLFSIKTFTLTGGK